MASKIDIISSALVKIGDLPINSLTTSGRQQQVANTLYDITVESELSKHRWGFARTKAQLSLTTDTPGDNEYQSVYQLPTDMIALIKINPNGRYNILGNKLYTNFSGPLYCDYIAKTAENEWPSYFVKMVEYALAIDFSISIRDSSTIQANMSALYDNASRMARYTDSQQYPQTPIQHRPFIDVRF